MEGWPPVQEILESGWDCHGLQLVLDFANSKDIGLALRDWHIIIQYPRAWCINQSAQVLLYKERAVFIHFIKAKVTWCTNQVKAGGVKKFSSWSYGIIYFFCSPGTMYPSKNKQINTMWFVLGFYFSLRFLLLHSINSISLY